MPVARARWYREVARRARPRAPAAARRAQLARGQGAHRRRCCAVIRDAAGARPRHRRAVEPHPDATSTTNQRAIVESLAAKGALAPGLDVDARRRHPVDAQPPRPLAAAGRRARLDARGVRALVRRHGLRAAAAPMNPSTAVEASRARVRCMDDDARPLLALGAALVTVTLWASAFVGIRSAGRDLSPARSRCAGCSSAARSSAPSCSPGASRSRRAATCRGSRCAGSCGSGSTTSSSTRPSGASTPARRRCSSTSGRSSSPCSRASRLARASRGRWSPAARSPSRGR